MTQIAYWLIAITVLKNTILSDTLHLASSNMTHQADAISTNRINGILEVSFVIQLADFGQVQLFEFDWNICGLEHSLDRVHKLWTDTITGDHGDLELYLYTDETSLTTYSFGGCWSHDVEKSSGQHLSDLNQNEN